MQVSFTPEFAERLREDLQIAGTRAGAVHNPHGGGNTYELERATDQDLILTSVGWANSYYADTKPYVDEWGIGWGIVDYDTAFGRGHYTEMISHPLADDDAIDAYVPPDPTRPELYREAEWVLRELKDEYWIVGVTVTTIFETAWALRGLEKMLTDLVLNPELAGRILDIPEQYHLTAARKLVEMGVDMIWCGDDVGAQRSMLISPQLWRKMLKPRLARFVAELKSINPHLKVAYHTDGMAYPIIPDLIDIGIDVLNPIQPACMDPAEVKRRFGNNLCYWGTIDEQGTLPRGTPQEVRSEVMERLKTIGSNGSLIIGPTHNVQLDTPLENFWAMVNTIAGTPYRSI
jgi:uroporphyrinogen decarboxylase